MGMTKYKYITACVLVLILGLLIGYKSVDPALSFLQARGGSSGDVAVQNGPWKTFKGLGTPDLNPVVKAIVAQIGLGALTAEEAIYWIAEKDENSARLNGKSRYTLKFNGEQLHQDGGFWSLSVYGPDHYFVPNSAGVNSLGLRDDLLTNPDGSFEITVSSSNPGNETNWLPAPESGPFSLTLRYYVPITTMISRPGDTSLPTISTTQNVEG